MWAWRRIKNGSSMRPRKKIASKEQFAKNRKKAKNKMRKNSRKLKTLSCRNEKRGERPKMLTNMQCCDYKKIRARSLSNGIRKGV